jgi:hypothetical protein
MPNGWGLFILLGWTLGEYWTQRRYQKNWERTRKELIKSCVSAVKLHMEKEGIIEEMMNTTPSKKPENSKYI